jgi:hypothetical protein
MKHPTIERLKILKESNSYHRNYIKRYHPEAEFYPVPEPAAMKIGPDKRVYRITRVDVVDGDPVDYTLGWEMVRQANGKKKIPVVNDTDSKGVYDWGTTPEACFARRSNLVDALQLSNAAHKKSDRKHHTGDGCYAPDVCTCPKPENFDEC